MISLDHERAGSFSARVCVGGDLLLPLKAGSSTNPHRARLPSRSSNDCGDEVLKVFVVWKPTVGRKKKTSLSRPTAPIFILVREAIRRAEGESQSRSQYSRRANMLQ